MQRTKVSEASSNTPCHSYSSSFFFFLPFLPSSFFSFFPTSFLFFFSSSFLSFFSSSFFPSSHLPHLLLPLLLLLLFDFRNVKYSFSQLPRRKRTGAGAAGKEERTIEEGNMNADMSSNTTHTSAFKTGSTNASDRTYQYNRLPQKSPAMLQWWINPESIR